jgi:mono/diheme cytochrome c family protein
VGSTVAVGRIGDRAFAFVADADEGAVVAVDLDTRQIQGRVPLGGTPAQLLVAHEGTLLVAVRDRARVAVFDVEGPLGAIRERASIPTESEPLGLAETPDGVLLVTCAMAQTLDAFRVADFAPVFQAALPREPRAVYPSPRHRRAYVAHLGAPLLSVVDLASPDHPVATFRRVPGIPVHAVRRPALGWFEDDAFFRLAPVVEGDAAQGYALARVGDDIVAPHVLAFTGEPAKPTLSTYGGVVTFDAATEVAAAARIRDGDSPRLFASEARNGCLLPRAALGIGGSYLLACADERDVIEVGGLRRRWLVARGISGLALDPSVNRAVAWAQFDRKLGILSADAARGALPEVALINLPPAGDALAERFAVGRALFHTSGDTRISSDGRACASCHPDGLDDGLTWPTPNGPRQTPSLRGRVEGTAPYGWLGRRPTLSEHLKQTVSRLGGSGLPEPDSASLISYVTAMRAPDAAGRAYADDAADARIARGESIFADRCGSCHEPWSGYTDGERHDVRSRAGGDRAAAFDTPSLRFVASTAPYFHDGRFDSLHALLAGSEGAMWHAPPGGLSDEDLAALEDYVRTL